VNRGSDPVAADEVDCPKRAWLKYARQWNASLYGPKKQKSPRRSIPAGFPQTGAELAAKVVRPFELETAIATSNHDRHMFIPWGYTHPNRGRQ
jgi:hypothetical protein